MKRHWFSDFLYDTTFWTSGPYFLLGNSLRTEGDRHVPPAGPLLVLANHQSFFDPVLVGLATRRRLAFLARDTLFRNPAFRWLITSLYAVPVDQEGTGLAGLKTTLRLLQAGRAVLVFPEGSRTPDGKLHPLEPGIHLLIRRAQPAIVPVGIAGAFDAWPCWRPVPGLAPLFLPPRQGTIAVSVGRALEPGRFAAMSREQCQAELYKEIAKTHARAERLRRKCGSSRGAGVPPARPPRQAGRLPHEGQQPSPYPAGSPSNSSR
jgi:1-acyl-sn-glycerol-3-phosphate acyltransferase